MEPDDCARDVPGQPADQGQHAAEEDIDRVVAGEGGGEAFLGELALAEAGDPDDGESAETAEDVDGGCAAGIEKAGAEGEVDAQLGQPSAGPYPMREKRKDGCGQDCGSCAAGGKAQAVRSRAPRNHGGQGYGQELKE